MAVDYTYRAQLPHRTGQLARVAGAIATGNGLFGDITTLNIGRDASIREIMVEVRNDNVASCCVADLVGALDDLEVFWFCDQALLRHDGGKLTVEPILPVTAHQHLRDTYTPRVARVCTAIEGDPLATGRYATTKRSFVICANDASGARIGWTGILTMMTQKLTPFLSWRSI